MNSVELIRRLHQHRGWVNQKLLAVARSLSEQQLRQTFAIGQGSLWQTLLHLYAAEYLWLEALLGDEDPLTPGDLAGKTPGNQQGAGAIADLNELQARWSALDRRWQEYLGNLAEANLDELVIKKSSGSGKRQSTRRSDVLLHVCTHAQYTTAQAINMLRQLGLSELPDVMLISLARSEGETP